MLRLYHGQKLLGDASSLMHRFNAQPEEVQRAASSSMMYGAFEGIDRSLKAGLRECLVSSGDAAQTAQQISVLRGEVRHAGERARLPETHQFFELLGDELDAWGTEPRKPNRDAGAALEKRTELVNTFGPLASAYRNAKSRLNRIRALVDHFPTLRFSRQNFPEIL